MNSKVKLLDNRKQTATIPKLVNLVNPIFLTKFYFTRQILVLGAVLGKHRSFNSNDKILAQYGKNVWDV